MRTPLVMGNWKMTGTLESSKVLASEIAKIKNSGADVVVCPPALYASVVADQISGSSVELGLQNVTWFSNGAYTGESSVEMASDLGAKYVLVGHSERRWVFGESNADTVKKVTALLESNVRPVLCIGETEAQRDAGEELQAIEKQLRDVLEVNPDMFPRTVVAYEPVWAIGTGKTATPACAQRVHAHIRSIVGEETQIIYGGSVKGANAKELFSQPDVDGGLIGGAALDASEFAAICNSVR